MFSYVSCARKMFETGNMHIEAKMRCQNIFDFVRKQFYLVEASFDVYNNGYSFTLRSPNQTTNQIRRSVTVYFLT